jgi:cysteine synthase A
MTKPTHDRIVFAEEVGSHADRAWRLEALRRLDAYAAERDAAMARGRLLWRIPLPTRGIEVYVADLTLGPTGSNKDLSVEPMIRAAIERGKIRRGTPLFLASSGSTARAAADVASRLRLPFAAVIPTETTQSKIAAIERSGGTIVLVDKPAEVYAKAAHLAAEAGGYDLDQFGAVASAKSSGTNVATLIAAEMADRTHPVASWMSLGVGTGLTLSLLHGHAVADGHNTRFCVVDPDSALFHAWTTRDWSATGSRSLIEGVGRPGVVPGFNPDLIDAMISVGDAQSIATIWWLARSLGPRWGGATGASVWGALMLVAHMRTHDEQGSVLAFATDRGRWYEDTLFNAEFVADNGVDVRRPTWTLDNFASTGEWDTFPC